MTAPSQLDIKKTLKNLGWIMACEDDCGVCGTCYEDWKHQVELEEMSDYRLEMEYDNKPVYAEGKYDDD